MALLTDDRALLSKNRSFFTYSMAMRSRRFIVWLITWRVWLTTLLPRLFCVRTDLFSLTRWPWDRDAPSFACIRCSCAPLSSRPTWMYVCMYIHMTHQYLWHDSLVGVTWLIRTCDMTHLYVIWFLCICDMTHSYVWHDAPAYVTWLIHVWYDSSMSRSYAGRVAFLSLDVTHVYVGREVFARGTWLIRM